MEKRGILNWRAWSIVRKAQVVGAITGAFVTAGVFVLAPLTGPHKVFDAMYMAIILIAYPASVISDALGCPLSLSEGEGMNATWSVSGLCLVIAVNSALSFLLGALIGYVTQAWRASSK